MSSFKNIVFFRSFQGFHLISSTKLPRLEVAIGRDMPLVIHSRALDSANFFFGGVYPPWN